MGGFQYERPFDTTRASISGPTPGNGMSEGVSFVNTAGLLPKTRGELARKRWVCAWVQQGASVSLTEERRTVDMDYNRLKCFLCYGHSYRQVMERVRSLLEVLDCDVSVFDGPDQQSAVSVVHGHIDQADFVVVLLGPDFGATPDSTQAASWPYDEAIYANARNKPIALIMHSATRVPRLLEGYQTPPRFDFADPASYADNVHHIVKHLLDTKRRFALPPGDAPYYYSRVVNRHRIEGRGYIRKDMYHQVVARQPWSEFHHSVDTGPDRSASIRLELLNQDDIRPVVTVGAAGHSVSIDWAQPTQHIQDYVVRVVPPLPAGGQIGYRRTFEVANFWPLTADALRDRALEPGFPKVFRQGSALYYGVSFEVTDEMETLTLAIQLPDSVPISSFRAVAIVGLVQQVNETETARVNEPGLLSMKHSDEIGESTIELNVARPLAGHSYVLLYEPGG